MKLCSFEIKTHLGRHQRLGAVIPEGIVDLNFACAWHLARDGESRPQVVADAVLPYSMLQFLQGGETSRSYALRTLEALSTKVKDRPQGINDETLIYSTDQVRLLAPLPNPASLRDFFAF